MSLEVKWTASIPLSLMNNLIIFIFISPYTPHIRLEWKGMRTLLSRAKPIAKWFQIYLLCMKCLYELKDLWAEYVT